MSIAEIVRPPIPSLASTSPWHVPYRDHDVSLATHDEDLQSLHRIGSRVHFARGETIFSEGDPAEYAYKVVSGSVRLCKHLSDGRRQIAQFLFAGDFFSFMELTDHIFTAEAVTDIVLVCYPQRQIERLGEERMSVRKQFTALLTRRVREIQKHLVLLGRQTAKERVASFVLMVIGHTGCEDDGVVEVPMNRQDIADYLGLTIETVCRVLSSMKREGLLGIPNLHQLIVNDVDALYAIADGEA